jgi:HD superfamily phosphohydrolase YqeK
MHKRISCHSLTDAAAEQPHQRQRPSREAPKSGLEAHCRRVAALALEISSALVPAVESRDALVQAALMHHALPLVFEQSAMDRLLLDLLPEAHAAPAPQSPSRLREKAPGVTNDRRGRLSHNAESVCQKSGTGLPACLGFPWPARAPLAPSSDVCNMITILRAFHGFPMERPRNATVRTLGEVLAISNLLDEELEGAGWGLGGWGPGMACDIPRLLADLAPLFQPKIIEAVGKILPGAPVAPRSSTLVLEPSMAGDALRLFLEKRLTAAASIADLAARDPVLEAALVRAANSARNGRSREIGSIGPAVAQLGLEASRKLAVALAVRPVFAGAGTPAAWRHGVWMAEFFEACARWNGYAPPEEAFTIGLIHDIGVVATQRLPRQAQATVSRLQAGGFALGSAESLVSGSDHGEMGATLLSAWGIPDHMVDAVRFHHRPAESDSLLAAGLYVAGFWAGDDEDPPSHRQLDTSLKRLRFSLEDLSRIQPAKGWLSNLLTVPLKAGASG